MYPVRGRPITHLTCNSTSGGDGTHVSMTVPGGNVLVNTGKCRQYLNQRTGGSFMCPEPDSVPCDQKVYMQQLGHLILKDFIKVKIF